MNKDLYYESLEEFVDCMIDDLECDEDKFISVIAKFEEAKEVLANAMLYGDVNFDFLEIESPMIDDYEDEFVLSFWMNDGVLEIGCEKLKDEDGDYISPGSDVVILFGDCSSKIIPLCEGSDLYFVNFDDECDCCDECDECCDCGCCCDDKEIANTEKHSYEINGTPVSKAEFEKAYEELYKKYEKNMKSILNNYCGFMCDFNNMFKRLW